METLLKIVSSTILLCLLYGSSDTCFTSISRSRVTQKTGMISTVSHTNTISDVTTKHSATISSKTVSTTSPQDRVTLALNINSDVNKPPVPFVAPLQLQKQTRQPDVPSVLLQGLLVRVPPVSVPKKTKST